MASGMVALISIAMLNYGLATFWLWRSRVWQHKLKLVSATAISVHLLMVVLSLWVGHTFNVSLSVMQSVVMALVCLLVWVIALFRPVQLLNLMLYPLSVGSLLWLLCRPSVYPLGSLDGVLLLHVFSAVLTCSVLLLSLIVSLLLACQDWLLRQKRILDWRYLPMSLQALERLLFQVIGCGFILLTLVLGSSVVWYTKLLSLGVVRPKLLLTLLAWIVFVILLLGRWRYGWRGKTVCYVTFFGVSMVLFVGVMSVLLEVL